MKRSNTGDDVFIAAPPQAVFRALISLPRDHGWWPGARVRSDGARLSVRARAFRRRARAVRFVARVEGVRPGEGLVWRIERGEVMGRGEWWLEAYKNGTVAHYFLDVGPGRSGRLRRWPSRVRRHRWAVRGCMNALKDRLESAGAPARV